MKRRAIVTVATRNYAHFAFALAESAQRHHPESDVYVCFADTPLDDSPPPSLSVHILLASQLGIADWKRFAFQYTPFELSCALKPYAMRSLFDAGYSEIVYLDADMRVLNPISEVFDILSRRSIVITPHLINPLPEDNHRPGEDLFLMAGTYNAGFIAVRRDEISDEFLNWWMARLTAHCFVDLSASLFVDQKWLNLVPGLFDNVHILRDPAYNTGHWTMPQFALSLNSQQQACIANKPIALFHFSNLSPGATAEFDHCQNRTSFSEQPVLQALVRDYHAVLEKYNSRNYASFGCEYDLLSDGTVIRPEWREAIRRNHPLLSTVSDPFDVTAMRGLVKRLASTARAARHWRKDWRLRGISDPRFQTRSKRLERRIKSALYTVGLRKKAA